MAEPANATHGPLERERLEARRQPSLHRLVVCLRAPSQVWSGSDGQVRVEGAQGVYLGDVRVLSSAVLTLDDEEPEPLTALSRAADEAVFVGLARHLGDAGPDPSVRVERRRLVCADGVREEISVISSAAQEIRSTARLAVTPDFSPMASIKAGTATGAAKFDSIGRHEWTDGTVTARVRGDDHSQPSARLGPQAELTWALTLSPGERVTMSWSLTADDSDAVVGVPKPVPEGPQLRLAADDRRLAALVQQSIGDAVALQMSPVGEGSRRVRDERAAGAEPSDGEGSRRVRDERAAGAEPSDGEPPEAFVAAGAPWYLTLFGRDSIWAARMLFPLGTELAGSTLRVLSARQGRRVDIGAAEEPGKVLHEMRRAAFQIEGGHARGVMHLPPVYYGTVDATPLWVCLLHDAWRWGLPADQVRELLPNLEAALDWMADHGDADRDGFLEYVDRTGTGLANQGWKDSYEAVQWRDGRLATPPIALCEVQGYAYEAAVGGADLLESFDRPGAQRWRSWAADLAERFRERFWVEDAAGPYPAIALDAEKRPVDALTSNAGHLLGTGILSAEETRTVAHRLVAPDMSSGYGLRTMSTTAAGFDPLSYHGGSVWPHDTAIVLAGLARAGAMEEAAVLVDGLLAAADGFDYRLPELFSGDPRDRYPRPVPYPAACHPQAWSATAGVALLTAVLGLDPDVPNGVLRVRPLTPSPVGRLRVDGLRLAGERLALSIDRDGRVEELTVTDRVTRHDA